MTTLRSSETQASSRTTLKKPFVVPTVEQHQRLTHLTFDASVAGHNCSLSSALNQDGLGC